MVSHDKNKGLSAARNTGLLSAVGDFLININILFQEGILDEDLLWSYLVFLRAKGVVVPQVTYIYEDNPGSIMNTSSARIINRIISRILICNTILDNPPCQICEEYYMYIFYVMIRFHTIWGEKAHKPETAII